jgi:hypothetical protein
MDRRDVRTSSHWLSDGSLNSKEVLAVSHTASLNGLMVIPPVHHILQYVWTPIFKAI